MMGIKAPEKREYNKPKASPIAVVSSYQNANSPTKISSKKNRAAARTKDTRLTTKLKRDVWGISTLRTITRNNMTGTVIATLITFSEILLLR